MTEKWGIIGVLVSVIGIIVAIAIFYIQKITKKQKIKRQITDIIKIKIQTKNDISAQYIGAEISSICKKNKIKEIEIIDVIDDLISEYKSIRNKNATQITEKLITLKGIIADEYWKRDIKSEAVTKALIWREANIGVIQTETEFRNNAKIISNSDSYKKIQKEVFEAD